MNSLKEKYTKEIIPELTKKYNYTTVMAVPKLEKIVVNMGVGDATVNSKLLDAAVSELEKITGQQPVITKAKKINCWIQSKRRSSNWMQGYFKS